ncbi:unnamed protein product [Diabrotica balteata]|uniref:Mannose-6-phosphate isomerase n=1 Tax=Diabrotica balteata TaxID=107213 RepID=A0A9N9T1P2_DIABA|nr:unnamed protein product [Diabrotica balteata]
MELVCEVQKYDWGKRGQESKVAQLIKTGNEHFQIEESSPYAELWMGTHVNAPSVVKETGQLLSKYISEHPNVLGEKVAAKFNNQLPFLFKVLSINNALSIQAHPTKQFAEVLHQKYPNIYKDPNHKPEMAIALTPFEALCGFRPPQEIRHFIEQLPELENITKSMNETDDVKFLEKSFRSILTCDKQLISSTIKSLQAKFKDLSSCEQSKYHVSLFDRLNCQFPNDNGVLMVYFLNYIKLKPSEAIFLAANEPHAYIYGDCIEIMASSDNVVRAGLTPKFVDVETLVSMLEYKGDIAEEKLFKPVNEDEHTRLFRPPVPDFAVVEIRIPNSVKLYRTIKRDSASIIIIIQGTGKSKNREIKPGLVLFLAADETFEVSEISSSTEYLLMYQAFANL